MAANVDRLLEERKKRAAGARWLGTTISAFLHVVLTAGFLFLPSLLAKPKPKIDYVSVVVVPPAALGVEDPPPPTPAPAPPPPTPAPPPKIEPPPPPPPKPADVPVIPKEEPKKRTERRKAAPPPEPAPPSRTERDRPPRRRGSARGHSLGASSTNAVLGVEDPNFTYGWYLDQLVNRISGNWSRPVVGSEVVAVIYFRVHSDGSISSLAVRQSSQLREFDDAAQRAIEASAPFPPLPRSYKSAYLGINLTVK